MPKPRPHPKNTLLGLIIAAITLITPSATPCDLDKLNRGQAGHGCAEDTGPGISDPSINPGTSFKTLIKLTPTTHAGITDPQRISKPGDTPPANSDTLINRFGPPLSTHPAIARRIYLTDGWIAAHGNAGFPLNVKSEAKYEEFKLHLENRDKGHECYFATTNAAGGCLECKADWTPANYFNPGTMACGANDTGWRPAIESAGIVPDGKACPRAFYTHPCNAPPDHVPPQIIEGRTCDAERNALSAATTQQDIDDAQQDLDDCEALPPCQWDYNEGPWSAWKPPTSGECPGPFVQTSVRTLSPKIIGDPDQCRHTAPNPPPHEQQRTANGTRPASDADCDGGPVITACATWETTPWDPATPDADLAAQTCIGDTAEKTRTVTAGPQPCTGTPSATRPASKLVIPGAKTCDPNAPVNGLCDNDALGGCKDGNPTQVTGDTWYCMGINGGTTSNECRHNPKGKCDNSVFKGCLAGTPHNPDTAAQTWTCQAPGGMSGQCSYTPPNKKDGICDNTTRNSCTVGTLKPNNHDPDKWTCIGINGGNDVSCEYKPTTPTTPQNTCPVEDHKECVLAIFKNGVPEPGKIGDIGGACKVQLTKKDECNAICTASGWSNIQYSCTETAKSCYYTCAHWYDPGGCGCSGTAFAGGCEDGSGQVGDIGMWDSTTTCKTKMKPYCDAANATITLNGHGSECCTDPNDCPPAWVSGNPGAVNGQCGTRDNPVDGCAIGNYYHVPGPTWSCEGINGGFPANCP